MVLGLSTLLELTRKYSLLKYKKTTNIIFYSNIYIFIYIIVIFIFLANFNIY